LRVPAGDRAAGFGIGGVAVGLALVADAVGGLPVPGLGAKRRVSGYAEDVVYLEAARIGCREL